VQDMRLQKVKMMHLIAEDIENLLSFEKFICGKMVGEAVLA